MTQLSRSIAKNSGLTCVLRLAVHVLLAWRELASIWLSKFEPQEKPHETITLSSSGCSVDRRCWLAPQR